MAMTGTGSLAAKSFAELKVDSTAVDYSAFTFIGAAASSVVTWRWSADWFEDTVCGAPRPLIPTLDP